MRKILIFFILVMLFNISCVSAVTNLKGNGDFDLYPNSPIKFATGWIGNDSTKWNMYYTSSTTLHSAQLINGTMVIKTGSDGGINDISIGGVPSSDPSLVNWQTYGTQVNGSTTYTAFAFMNVNKTNAVYFNVRQAYANGTMIAALISSRNTGTGYQFLQYQFTTSPNVMYCRVSPVTRNANTEVIYYAVGAYQGTSGQLNKAPQILTISPVTSILENMQPTFSASFYDEDSTVGICNDVALNINGVVYNYDDCSGYTKNNLFLPDGVSNYNVTIYDNWVGNTVTDTYSLFVPTISYVDVVNEDASDQNEYTGLFSERFIYFVVYIAIMIILQSRFTSGNTLYLFGIIEMIIEVVLLMDVSNYANYGGTTLYLMMLISNAYLVFLSALGIQGEK